MSDRSVEVVSQSDVFHRAIFRWFETTYRYELFDGKISEPTTRLVLDRGDSVGMLLHDVVTDEIILVEQFRIATIGNGSGWVLEIPAGRVERDEDPRDCAIREVKEETGATAVDLERIASFYLSPGGCTEKLHLFYCPFNSGLVVDSHAGLASEGEDIKVHRLPLREAVKMIESGAIDDAKSIVALQWLQLKNR